VRAREATRDRAQLKESRVLCLPREEIKGLGLESGVRFKLGLGLGLGFGLVGGWGWGVG
jgi:hypothetical protein